MAGESITKQFNIGTSTVMIGPMEDVMNLTPEQHSIGLIKAYNLTSETTEVELTEGLRNNPVDSQVTGVDVTMSFEVYEYTTSNLAYAALLDGSKYSTGARYEIATAVTGGPSATSVVLKSETDVSSSFTVGGRVQLQTSLSGKYDKVFVGKIASAAYDDTLKQVTLTLAYEIPAGWSFAAGDALFTTTIVPLGSNITQPYLGIKIVGVSPSDGNKPITIIVPRAKVSGGFSLGFNTDSYANMPFEVKAYNLNPSDVMYTEFTNEERGQVMVMP